MEKVTLSEDSIIKKVRFKESDVNTKDAMAVEDSNTKKVYFKESDGSPKNVMVVESSPAPSLSWKDMLLGIDTPALNKTNGGHFLVDNFSLSDTNDYNKILSQGPWVIFGYYLTVQPWTIDFNPNLPYPNLVLTWIRFPDLPSHLYQKQILIEIRGMTQQGELSGCYKFFSAEEKGEKSEQTIATSEVAEDGESGPWMTRGEFNGGRFKYGKSQGFEEKGKVTIDPHEKLSTASCDGDHVKVDTPTSVQKQAQPVVHFNPTFEENSFVNVAVKEGVLEAKNHSAMVFKRNSILEPISEETKGSVCPSKIKLPREFSKG
ncbi:hypothetical protein GOBAR_AA10557 [Gossypium barbadense]|uniref:DUF4283 domain-containing protein n=1 Tax=Gossypium barbadense TaxID=3634 RepID=A0A2P5Y3A5_GOSBA|nr:hypothetical protein GOBAR_AA10557 [Gossypium barbadense]